mgnify:CR=1 FL=1
MDRQKNRTTHLRKPLPRNRSLNPRSNEKGEGLNMTEQNQNPENQNLGRDGNQGFHQVGSSPTGGASNIL